MQGRAPADAVSQAGLRFTPFPALLDLVDSLDRVNIGFAALTVNQALGLGASAFCVGYGLFEVPGTLVQAAEGLAGAAALQPPSAG